VEIVASLAELTEDEMPFIHQRSTTTLMMVTVMMKIIIICMRGMIVSIGCCFFNQ